MDTQAIIENYIQEVADHLPRRLRNDVGLELRGLLTEHLEDAARGAGRAIDSDTTVEVLRRFGRPEEVAARYAPNGFDLVEPQLAPWFVRLAVAGVGLQWAFSLPRVFASEMTLGEWWTSQWGYGALWWVGMLVVWFGLATWVRRRNPVNPDTRLRHWSHYFFWVPTTTDWRPVDREAIERRAAVSAFPLGVALTVFLVAPAWFIGLFARAGTDTSWALYDGRFQQWLLLPIIVMVVARLVLAVAVTLKERWRTPTEGMRIALWMGSVALLYWALFGWQIFAHRITDALFKTWLLIFLIVNSIQIIVWLRRQATRVRVPRSLAGLK